MRKFPITVLGARKPSSSVSPVPLEVEVAKARVDAAAAELRGRRFCASVSQGAVSSFVGLGGAALRGAAGGAARGASAVRLGALAPNIEATDDKSMGGGVLLVRGASVGSTGAAGATPCRNAPQ